jgi:putative ABC transport system permease protein
MLGRAGRSKESASVNVREAVVIAAQSMRTARLRTLLTAMGIVLGVAAVIVLVGLGGGMRSGFNQKFGALTRG